MSQTYYDVSKEETLNLSEVENLILSILEGLSPEHLSKQECQLLEDEYGENWFEKLGYAERAYKKPIWR